MELGVDKTSLAKVGITFASLPINTLTMTILGHQQSDKATMKFIIRVEDNLNNEGIIFCIRAVFI